MRLSLEGRFKTYARPVFYGFCVFAALLVSVTIIYATSLGPPGTDRTYQDFIVSPDQSLQDVSHALQDGGYVRFGWVFNVVYRVTRGENTIRAGGYRLTKSMDALTVSRTLAEAPYLAWVTVPAAIRMEQVADILTEALAWTSAQKDAWITAAHAAATSTIEGRYFPDTYLIPSDQAPEQIVARFHARFAEQTEAYELEALRQEESWDDVVILASLVEREAAKNDKALVAGILWNRLKRNMPLQVDATLQYAVGTKANWWPVPKSEDKYVDSPLNTYQHVGLPPYPIATPSLESLAAVLEPTQTSCLFYIHDTHGRIHCAKTYAQHKANVNLYLR